MKRFAKLSYTSNPKLQEFIGCVGELEQNAKGGYNFRMRDNGKTFSTTCAQSGTILGDVDVPNCRNLGFQTRSGTVYQFDFMDYERAIDGTRMERNRFMGYQDDNLNHRLDKANAAANTYNAQARGVVAHRFDYDK